jgi:hypothetical protein
VNAKDLQRYKTLLLAKQEELSVARDGATALVPPAGESEGDLIDQTNSDAEGMRPEMARLTLARKIATIVLIVWKRGVCFDAQRLKPQTA